MSDSMDLQQQRMRTDMKAILSQEEMRNSFDLETDKLSEEQKEFHNLSDAQAESVRISEILNHSKELNLTNIENRSLALRYNRDRNLLLINNKQSSGDSPQMENLKDSIRAYEMFLRVGTEGTATDVERMSEKAVEMCNTVIRACDAYLDRGAPFFFWRRGRYKEVVSAKRRFSRELKMLETMKQEMDATYGQYINEGESLLDILSTTSTETLAKRAALRKASNADKEITKETNESKEAEVNKEKEENEKLFLKIVGITIEKDYALAPQKKVTERMEEFGEKFETKEQKTKKDLKELERKAKEKAALDAADAREQKRIDKILKDCGSADFKNIPETMKRNLAALMGNDRQENRELLRKYNSGGAERENTFLNMIDKFLSIDTKDLDLSSTEAMIKQSDRLEKIMDATYSMIRIINDCDDIYFKMPANIKNVIKAKMDVIQPMAAVYKNKKNMVTHELYAKSLDKELTLRFDPNMTPEQLQLLTMVSMDVYTPAYAGCFKDCEKLEEEYPEDSKEAKARYQDYLNLGNCATHEFSKNSPIGFEKGKTKHYDLLKDLLDLKKGGLIYTGFVSDDVTFDGDKRESIVRSVGNLTNLQPVEKMSEEEVRALIYRFCLRETEDMDEEEKNWINEQKKQAYREMRDIMLAHVDYLKKKYGNGYKYLSPKELLEHDEEITRDFHCNTNISEFMIFVNRHKELSEDKKEEIQQAIDYLAYMMQANGLIRDLRRGVDEKTGMNAAIMFAMKYNLMDAMAGSTFETSVGVLAVDLQAQKPDKVNWDCKYEDKLEHKKWDKTEVDNLEKEAKRTRQAVEDYKNMKTRQVEMMDYTDAMMSGVKMVIRIKNDATQPKLTEQEVKSLFFLSKELDEKTLEKVVNLYLKGKTDANAMKEAKDFLAKELGDQFNKEAPLFREYAKERREIIEKGNALRQEGKFLSREDNTRDRVLDGKQEAIAYKFTQIPALLREVFPDFEITGVDEGLLKEVREKKTYLFGKDNLFLDNLYRAYSTNLIERDIRDVEKKKKESAKKTK